MTGKYDVVIIGGGLAGLSAAIELEKFNLKVLILEKEDRVGGRVKTDVMNGYRLDRGFQVYLTEYPEGKALLDYDALNLSSFAPGAICFNGSKKFEVYDTTRDKWAVPKMAMSPVGDFMDKVRMGNLNARLKKATISDIFERPEHTTMKYLQGQRFSKKIVDRFFQPFLSSIFLEPGLDTSSRMFEFVFKMFAQGAAAVPAGGMEQIPIYLKNALKRTEFRFHTQVKSVGSNEVILENEENIHCENIIVATASPLIPQMASDIKWQSAATYYFAANRSVLKKNIIALQYNPKRLVNNFAVMSDISKHYSPKGKHLVSVSLTHIPNDSVEEVTRQIRNELSPAFGPSVHQWEFLKNYHINKALPDTGNARNDVPITETRIRDGLYLAGDQLLNASINGALKSGKLAAQAAVLHFDANRK